MSRDARRDALLRRLDDDHAFYARHAVKIVGPGGLIMPLEPKPAQLRFFAAAEAQRAAGEPMRLIVLKARKLGFSTAGASMLVQRTTRKPNHNGLIVGQDARTASELFQMAELMYNHLPAEIKPPLTNWSRGDGKGYFYFGEPARQKRNAGEVGLNSTIRIDNAREASGGRGFTFRTLLLTEVAFWMQVRKLLAILNAVPDEPDTLVILESTANGHNHFKERWDDAESGRSSYVPIFAPWHEEAAYRVAITAEREEEFWAREYGREAVGEDEPRLVEHFGCDAAQLLWRRRTIADRCSGSIDEWNQEYPASPEDAFIATGRTRFAKTHVKRVLARTRELSGERGVFRVGGERVVQLGSGEAIPVPTKALWVPAAQTELAERESVWWELWEHPRQASTLDAERQRYDAGEITLEAFDALSGLANGDGEIPPGQYIEAADVMGGEENETGENAFHAIQVIDHQTLAQVAEFGGSRVDASELAMQAFLAWLYFNEPWLAVETTGGWGIPVVKDYLWRRYRCSRLYKRVSPEAPNDKARMVLGWDTNRRTKPQIEAGADELLKEGTDGIRSHALAKEMLTFVRQSDGKTGPSYGSFSDRLMAWMIAQQVAREKLPRRMHRGGGGGEGLSTYAGGPRNPKTGY